MDIDVLIKHVQKGFKPIVKKGWGNWFPEKYKSSESFRDCVSRMLQLNTAKRATAAEILDHPWVRGEGKDVIGLDVIRSILHISNMSKFQKIIYVALLSSPKIKAAHPYLTLSSQEIKDTAKTFLSMDKDKSGEISLSEFKEMCHEMHLDKSEDVMRDVFEAIESISHTDKFLDIKEFLLARIQLKLSTKYERLNKLFEKLCGNNEKLDSKILTNILQRMNVKIKEESVSKFMKETNITTTLKKKDFVNLFHAQKKEFTLSKMANLSVTTLA